MVGYNALGHRPLDTSHEATLLIIRLFALHTSSGADGREGGRAAATRLYSIRKVLLRHAPRPCQYETRAMCAAWEAMGTQTEN